jgi:hypothetical protein
MQKAEAQYKHTQSQPAVRQGKGASLESPQGERIAQLEAMADSSPQAVVQRGMMDSIHNSLRMIAQRKAVDAIHNSPHLMAQWKQPDGVNGETAQLEEAEESLQAKVDQREAAPAKPNNTGLPDNLRATSNFSLWAASSPVLVAQRFVGGAPLHGQFVLQRVSDQEVGDAAAECDANNVAAVKLYSQGWKKKSNQSRVQILNSVRDHEAGWTAVRDHVMLGGGGAPPTGYHSKALGGEATSVGVGTTNPASIGPRTVYKQWTKQRGQVANNRLKISTFFPDGWDETKIRTCVLLSFSSVAHQMSDQLALDSPGAATFYPATALADPPQPA